MVNDAINEPFTIIEVKYAIKQLKNSEAGGVDCMINAYFKYSHVNCIQIIVDDFTIVLCTGYGPTEWCMGAIHPIYKKKGHIPDNPDNYRDILSCTSKLFL